MALIDEVRQVCERLAPHGWGALLAQHGLDLTASDLRGELLRDLADIDRGVPGFEDFSPAGRRGVEPGRPASSVLFHALASPNVVEGATGSLGEFPTLAEIEAVEDFVFGAQPPSLAELRARFPDAELAIAVFASEYRPAPDTVHRSHADMCMSRCGVARVGTAAALYDARARGFVAQAAGDDAHTLRVLPARYAAYLAVRLNGDAGLFGPMNFDLKRGLSQSGPSDDSRSFWVPVHKLFAGDECLRDLNLTVELEAHHLNEKLRRVHRQLHALAQESWREPDIDEPPFAFEDGLAELSTDADDGRGVLVPTVHDRLVEPADYRGEPLTFLVPSDEAIRGPEGQANQFAPSLTLHADQAGFRPAPEYVHARRVVAGGEETGNLNDELDPAQRVLDGGFRARHYVDFTGDGWVRVTCREVEDEGVGSVPAYSVVTAPDFYPTVEQRELVEWWINSPELAEKLWLSRPPFALSDERIAPNLQLEEADFDPEDTAPTAIVSLPEDQGSPQPWERMGPARHTHLPDGAAGVFAPGWDTSRDTFKGTEHLAAYGLGSPFPEDAKLCAALSSFWPAVAPDAGRSFSTWFATATPLTDEEIGSDGDLPWDGVAGPRPVSDGDLVEFASFDHVDYVESALDSKFSLALTNAVDTTEYMARILAVSRAYEALGIDRAADPVNSEWTVLSFKLLGTDRQELTDAEEQAGEPLSGGRYRIAFGRRNGPPEHAPGDHRRLRVEIVEDALLFVGDGSRVLVKNGEGAWAAKDSF